MLWLPVVEGRVGVVYKPGEFKLDQDLTGRVFEGGGTAASPLIGFRRAITTAGEPWRVEDTPNAEVKDNFSLTGVMTDAR